MQHKIQMNIGSHVCEQHFQSNLFKQTWYQIDVSNKNHMWFLFLQFFLFPASLLTIAQFSLPQANYSLPPAKNARSSM